MATSPTALTIDYLYSIGCTPVQKVEVWNAFAKRRVDLFGCWDILAIKGKETIAVQCTSRGNMSSRIKKIAESEYTPMLREAGWTLWVIGWDKQDGKYRMKLEDVS